MNTSKPLVCVSKNKTCNHVITTTTKTLQCVVSEKCFIPDLKTPTNNIL